MQWEKIKEESSFSLSSGPWERIMSRMKVFGGWLVKEEQTRSYPVMTFVPDPNHEWKIGDDKQ